MKFEPTTTLYDAARFHGAYENLERLNREFEAARGMKKAAAITRVKLNTMDMKRERGDFTLPRRAPDLTARERVAYWCIMGGMALVLILQTVRGLV